MTVNSMYFTFFCSGTLVNVKETECALDNKDPFYGRIIPWKKIIVYKTLK